MSNLTPIDRHVLGQIIDGNNEGVDMKENLHKLSRYIDQWYKRTGRLLDSLNMEDPPNEMSILEMSVQLRTLKFVAEEIEKKFRITVLTEPRD